MLSQSMLPASLRAPTTLGEEVGKEDASLAQLAAENVALQRAQGMVEDAPISLVFADRELVIRYANKSALGTLRALQAHLPISVEQVIGKADRPVPPRPAETARDARRPAPLEAQRVERPDRAGREVDLGRRRADQPARAQRHDRGRARGRVRPRFSVVASEVKEPREAERGGERGDRAGTSSAIRDDTSHAVDSIREVGHIIEKIHELQGSISSAVEEQSATTQEIGRSVAETAQANGEIARSITTVSKVAEGTAAGVGQAEQAVAELVQLAVKLNELVANA
jgi:hypothetical protein